MAQQDVYNTVWSFSHPEADGSMSTGIDYRLSSVIQQRTEAEYAEDLAELVRTELETEYLPLIPDSMTLVQVEVRNITNPVWGAIDPSGQLGTINDNPVALRSAPVAKKNTGLLGRSNRGRMYLMAPAEQDQNAGNLGNGYVIALGNFLNTDMIQLVSAGGNIYEAVVYSKLTGIDNLISNFQVRDTMGSVRGRQAAS